MTDMLWHPHAKRHPMEDAGTFTGGGKKFIVHTAQGKDLETILRVLDSKRAAPHFVLGVHNGKRQLVQCIPTNRAARALAHPSGPETNRSNALQVEVLEYAANAHKWDPRLYRYLHLLLLWGHRHFGVPMEAHFPFYGQDGYHRLSGPGFYKTTGVLGHCHVPGNDHWDPGNLNMERVFKA